MVAFRCERALYMGMSLVEEHSFMAIATAMANTRTMSVFDMHQLEQRTSELRHCALVAALRRDNRHASEFLLECAVTYAESGVYQHAAYYACRAIQYLGQGDKSEAVQIMRLVAKLYEQLGDKYRADLAYRNMFDLTNPNVR